MSRLFTFLVQISAFFWNEGSTLSSPYVYNFRAISRILTHTGYNLSNQIYFWFSLRSENSAPCLIDIGCFVVFVRSGCVTIESNVSCQQATQSLGELSSYPGPFCGRARVHTAFDPSPYDTDSLKLKVTPGTDYSCPYPQGSDELTRWMAVTWVKASTLCGLDWGHHQHHQ